MLKPTHYYQRERRKGRVISALLHAFFLMLAITGLPSFLSPPPPEEPAVITVEILPITGITNVKPSDSTPAEEVKPEEKKNEQKKPSPPVKTAENTPPPPEPLPSEKEKEEKEKEKAEELKKKLEEKKKKEEEKKKKLKKQEDDLAAVLKAVKDTAQKEKKDKKKDEEKKENTSPSKSVSNQYNPTLPMSLSEKDAIMSQIAKCWTVPAGAKDAQNLVVVLNAEYNTDGSYIRVEMSGETKARALTDSFFRSAAESAIRAVKQCSPLKDLPPQKYDTWHFMELRFDPKYMLN